MRTQPDLFAPAPQPQARACGTCVVRNAWGEADPLGDCSRTNTPRAADAPACADWFGLRELRAPLYGRRP